MALVSIIVPVYNVEAYIRKCLDSIVDQTLKDIEIIVVDDGSPDNCPSIIDEYAAKDNRITAIHKKNGGVSAARNDGLKAATGEYVFICDSDDWMELDALEKMYKIAKTSNADVVIADHYADHINGNAGYSNYCKGFSGSDGFTTDDKTALDYIQASCLTLVGIRVQEDGLPFSGIKGNGAPWMHLYKRDIIDKNNIQYDVSLKGIFDDIWFNLCFYSHVKIAAYIPTACYHYRIMQGTSTKKFKPDLVQIYRNAFHHADKFLASVNNRKIFMTPYLVRKIGYLDRMMTFYFLNNNNDKTASGIYQEFKTLIAHDYRVDSSVGYKDIRMIERKKVRAVAWLLKYKLYGVYWILRKNTSILTIGI